MLASDVANPEYVNPTNPDSVLHAEFYFHLPVISVDDRGRDVRAKDKVVYVRIQKPGDNTSIIETPAWDHHKRRFPNQWLHFQMAEGMLEVSDDIPGIKVEDWPELQAEQLRELKYLRFYTVEQIAGASDAQVQRMGMGGAGLRERARQFLKSRMDQAVKTEIAARDKVIAEQGAALAALQEQMATFAATMNAAPAAPPTVEVGTEPKAKRPYKRKAKEAA